MMIKKYIIKEQECGYLMKDGRFVELLTAGRYSYLNMLGYEVQGSEGSAAGRVHSSPVCE